MAEVRLPRLDGAGQPSGGVSAATYRADRDELWLLSDAPVGQLVFSQTTTSARCRTTSCPCWPPDGVPLAGSTLGMMRFKDLLLITG